MLGVVLCLTAPTPFGFDRLPLAERLRPQFLKRPPAISHTSLTEPSVGRSCLMRSGSG